MLHNRNITPIKLAVAALLVLLVSTANAEWKTLVQAQGNNVGLTVSTAYGGPMRGGTPTQFPRGSGNVYVPGRWNWGLNAARDTNGDGVSDDTVSNLSRAGYFPGMLCALEAYDLISSLAAAGEDMEDAASRVSVNRVRTTSDPDDLSDWPAQFREGRSASGAPILHGAETIVTNNGDAFRDGSVIGASIEWRFHFLNFAESNDMIYAHVFFRNMSEYIQWNPYPSTVAKIANTAETGQTWIGAQMNYNWGNGFYIGGRDEAWAYYFPREIIVNADANGIEGSFTTHPAMVAMQMLRRPQYKDQEILFTNCLAHGWNSEYGAIVPEEVQEGGYPMGKAYRYGNGRYDPTAPFYPLDTNPITNGGPLYGWPGVLLPSDQRYNQWIWGTRNANNSYNTWGEFHDVAPRDSFSIDVAYAFVLPANPPFAFPPTDIANMDNPVVQQQLAPVFDYMDVAQIVYEGGFILPETPNPPPMTIIPGDRQVTITWSDVNVHTPDAYYGFLQDNPALDPDGVYREYDFEGYKLYRSYVGPSDSHSEQIWESSVSAGDLSFYYVDKRDDDNPLFRMTNGMRVWYALVPYDVNVDPATGAEFSLPLEASGKLWNRAGAQLYTVQPRSNASNYKESQVTSIAFTPYPATAVVAAGVSASLAGQDGMLTEAPRYLEPGVELEFIPVNTERITSAVSVSVRCSDWAPNGSQAGRRYVTVETGTGNVLAESRLIVKGWGDHGQTGIAHNEGMSADGVTWALTAEFDVNSHSDWYTQIDPGSYSGATIDYIAGGLWDFDWNNKVGMSYHGAETNKALCRAGEFVITWKTASGGLTLQVMDNTRGVAVPFSPYIDDMGWGFMPPGEERVTYHDEWGIEWGGPDNVEVPQGERSTLLVETVPANNTEEFNVWIDGQIFAFSDIAAMPSDGTQMVVRCAFGDWSGDTFIQYADAPAPGEFWKIDVTATTLNPEDADLSKIMVVPNPYMASSPLDLSPSQRRLEFVNLPARCTIRIYSLGGHLVNVLNHIGANRHGWGDYEDFDRLDNDGNPREFEGWDNHGGTEAWNLQNRFGQTVASGLYFYHVTDERGETHTGKFYVIN